MSLLIRREDITAKVVTSSICSLSDIRIDTLQLRYPRIIHADFMTHRVFSRNASSSRAIPSVSLMKRDSDPFIPLFRKNRPGMQPGDYLSAEDQAEAVSVWLKMAEAVKAGCLKLSAKDGLDIHKQWSNRPLEWFGYIDVVLTATDFTNFLYLRDHEAAQDEIQLLAQAIAEARDKVSPTVLLPGEWHKPYICDDDEVLAYRHRHDFADRIAPIFSQSPLRIAPQDKLLLITSAARACRVSFSKHDGTQSTFAEDIDRFFKLVPENDPVHASPLEHQATPLDGLDLRYQGNLRGYGQFRKMVPREALFG